MHVLPWSPLYLHENNQRLIVALAYDRGICGLLQVEQERYFREGEWLDAKARAAQPLYRQVGWNLARLFGPLL